MHRSIRSCLLLSLLIVVGKVSLAQTASFNFTNAAVSVSGWVNVAGDPYVAVRTATDPATGFGVSSVSTSNWALFNSQCAYNGGGTPGGTFFPAAVMANDWFQYNSPFSAAYNPAKPQLLLTGLNPDSVYTLKMSASLGAVQIASGSFTGNPTRFTVAGAVTYGYIDVNEDTNTSRGATFSNIAPDASGQVKIFVNTAAASNFVGIAGLQIITGRSAGPAPTVSFTRPMNNSIIAENNNVLLNVNATDSGASIARVEFYVGNILLGVDSTAPYSFTWPSPDPGSYTLKARAIDGLGYSNTATVSINIESLNYFWSTTGNIATGADSSFIGTVDTNRLAFRTNNIERMTILKDGTIGIGTKKTSGNALAVNGTGLFTKVKVLPIGSWPDYVFRKDFHLPGLPELERYVHEHQHLPGIASEQEVKANGIDVGEQQAALLKKVEELTLYLIDESKQLKSQQQIIDSQRERLNDQQKQIDQLRALILKKN